MKNNPNSADLTLEGHEILFPALPYHMADRVSKAIADQSLQQSVEVATMAKLTGRLKICNDTFNKNYEPLKQLAGEIKQHTLDHLDYYLNQFVDNASKQGVQVHFAKNGTEANAICLEIAKQENCKLCVKSKSMVTEETGLLPELEEAGIETVETDLGEFIIQLDHDAPSHIVTPMIHKDRFDVAKAFEREIGAKYTEDPEELTKIARQYLREKYHQADLGISGVNFLVAETGSMVICTNEGNATFCTTAPRVHIAFVGIEKLVPSNQHLTVLLKLLARSSTAQPLTVYTDIITGPKRKTDAHGPEQVHVILIDNGRSDILQDEKYREALRCIRCGACLNACPVYRKVGGHSYGAVYSGPIGAVITPLFKGLSNYKDLPNASSLCGACFDACPVKIDLPALLIKLRGDLVGGGKVNVIEKMMYKMYALSLKSSPAYLLTNWMQRKGLRLMAGKDGYVKKMMPPGKAWTDHRDLPAPAKHNFRHWWKKRS